jgi:hypothetical protein
MTPRGYRAALTRARRRHTNALLNALTRDRVGDLRELAEAGRELVRQERLHFGGRW